MYIRRWKLYKTEASFNMLRSPSTLYVLSPKNVSVVSWNKKNKKAIDTITTMRNLRTTTKSSPCSLQLVKSLSSTEDLAESKIIDWFFKIIMIKKEKDPKKKSTNKNYKLSQELRVGQVCACSLKVTDNISLVFSVTFK